MSTIQPLLSVSKSGTKSDAPYVFWLFGLSAAGKSTLAEALTRHLQRNCIPHLRLDGDEVRAGMCSDLTFNLEDRAENIRRVAEVANLATASGLWVVASLITPLEIHRKLIRKILKDRVSLIYLKCDISVCSARDPKQLYSRAAQGKLPLMSGLGSGFESPGDCDLLIETDVNRLRTCQNKLVNFARSKLTNRPRHKIITKRQK